MIVVLLDETNGQQHATETPFCHSPWSYLHRLSQQRFPVLVSLPHSSCVHEFQVNGLEIRKLDQVAGRAPNFSQQPHCEGDALHSASLAC
jgi:hypothetical protein